MQDQRLGDLSADQLIQVAVVRKKGEPAPKPAPKAKKKKGKDQNQGLQHPILVDFAQVGQDGPWVAAKLQTQTQLGAAVIELGRLQAHGRLPHMMAWPNWGATFAAAAAAEPQAASPRGHGRSRQSTAMFASARLVYVPPGPRW